MTYVKVKNTPYIRDINTMALLNTDRKAVNKDDAYKREAAKNKEKEQQILELKNEVHDLKRIVEKLLEKVENSNG
jgi:hypothetical protein